MADKETEGRARPRGSAREEMNGFHRLAGVEHSRDIHLRRCSCNRPDTSADTDAHRSGTRAEHMGGDVSPWCASIFWQIMTEDARDA